MFLDPSTVVFSFERELDNLRFRFYFVQEGLQREMTEVSILVPTYFVVKL